MAQLAIGEDKEHVPSLRHTNDVGVFVTAGDRMHLYRYLDRFQDNALYCDTFCDLCSAEKRTRTCLDGGQFRGHDFETETGRIHLGIFRGGAEKLRLQNNEFYDRRV